MPLGVGDILQRSVVLGSLGLAVYAAVMTGQGWQERLGRRRQAYQDQLEAERQKAFDMGFPTQSTQTGSAPS